MIPLIGVTPRSRRAAIRRERARRERRLASIAANLEGYEWQKEQTRQNHLSEERCAKLDAETDRHNKVVQTILQKMDKPGSYAEQIIRLVSNDDDDEEDDT
jgi:hypothetical protein